MSELVSYASTDDGKLAEAVGSKFAQETTATYVLLTGKCTRCDHTFTAELPLTKSDVVPGAGVAGMGGGTQLEASPIDHVVICSCSEAHPGQPEGLQGCGAMARVTVGAP